MDKFSDRVQVIVSGYPRSGNTWVCRLLGDVLDSPVTGAHYAVPISMEGLERPGKYVIRQLHLHPRFSDEFDCAVPNAYTFHVPSWNGEKLLHVYRDPRDVIVSAWHYWRRETMDEGIDMILNGVTPVQVHGSWKSFNDKWFNLFHVDVWHLRYEDLLESPAIIIGMLLTWLEAEKVHDINEVVERQSFENRKKYIEQFPKKHTYNRGLQLHAMYRGVAGGWREHFTREQGRRIDESIGEDLIELGYETNHDWWKDLPE